MRILFQRILAAVLLAIFLMAPQALAAYEVSCDPVEQDAMIGQPVHLRISGDTEGYHLNVPGGRLLVQGASSATVQFVEEGFFPITAWNDVGERSVCYVRVRPPLVGDRALETSIRTVVAGSRSPQTGRSFMDVSARIANVVDVAMMPSIILIASISALLFVGYNGSAVFRRRHRLGNIDVVRPKKIDLKK
jgi:uncharacterized protein (DUF2237 family)